MIVNVPPAAVRRRFNLDDWDDDELISVLLSVKPALDEELAKYGLRIVFFSDRPASRLPRRLAMVVWTSLERELQDVISVDEL